MITLVSFSKNEVTQFEMIAYEEAIFSFKLVGNLTYTDSLAQVWNWNGVKTEQSDILGIRYDGINLVKLTSIALCKQNELSFYFDNVNKILYIHFDNGQDFYSIHSNRLMIQSINITVSDSFDNITSNYYDGVFYKPELESVSGNKFSADPIKLGMLGSQEMSIIINNGSGQYDNLDDKLARGSIVLVDLVEEGQSTPTRIFTGYSKELKVDNKNLTINAIEQRFFQDSIVCKNTLEIATYPNLDTNLIGSRIPVALGDIRRGHCVPVNSAGVDRGDSASITFLVSDPSLGPVRAISKFYDQNGSEITGFSVNLTNCTITWTKPANIDIDLKKCKWEGQGHNLGFGTYNNGIDIIRYAFLTFANVADISTVFDYQSFIDVAASNPQAVGLSIKSDKGLTQEILESICTSLQVLVLTKGVGQLSIIERDITADPVVNFDSRLLSSPISKVYDTKYFTNSLKVNYAPDFTDDAFSKSYTNNDYYDDIIRDYGNVTTSQISPLKTVLFSEADAIALSNEVMTTSKRPDKIITFDIVGYYDLQPFDIISIDTTRNPNIVLPESIKYCEILSIEYTNERQSSKISARFISEPVFLTDQYGNYLLTMGNDYLIGSEAVEI